MRGWPDPGEGVAGSMQAFWWDDNELDSEMRLGQSNHPNIDMIPLGGVLPSLLRTP